jgi:Holliday junction resolvase RusA-like endonuclease
MKSPNKKIKLLIYGAACSKANSRRLVFMGGKPRFIKSKKALDFEKAVKLQAPRLSEMLEGDLSFHADIYYPNRRSDLDPSILLDALQGIVYPNDRAFKQITSRKFLDKKNPRCEIEIAQIEWDETNGK